MTTDRGSAPATSSSGLTLVEVMVALVVVSIGIMAFARIIPEGSRSEVGARMQSTACQYANEVFETTRNQTRTSAALSLGRHPASGYDSLGTTRAWRRYYVVSNMASPLDSLLKIVTTVRWSSAKPESVRLTGYQMP